MKLRLLSIIVFSLGIFASCNQYDAKSGDHRYEKKDNRIVIWTSCREFAQYIELFNAYSQENRAILVYKENPALSVPPAKDELPPDIIVGSWLRNDSMQKSFCNLDYLFSHKKLFSSMFYENLLDSGKHFGSQFLIPVSFNLPAVIFDSANSSFVNDNYMLTLEQLRSIGAQYNQKKQNGSFSRIGFAPLNDDSFLSLAAKLFDSDFEYNKKSIVWNEKNLGNAVTFLKDWVETENESARIEEDFAFKYLFMPYYRQVLSGRTLFAATKSDLLFKNLHEQEIPIDYRWIVQNGKIYMDDSFVMMGVYKKSKNRAGASEFITWFCQAEVQREILERKEDLRLETELFGIAGGFSALRSVTEHVLPVFYTHLLSNLPPAQMLEVPNKLPARWESYKALVVEPYIRAEITEANTQKRKSITEYEREWRKKVFAE